MSVKFRDYYQTLGVSRDASQEEIKRAYRALARQHHPDVNKEEGGSEKFREITEAYEVLKNPETRKRYDRLGANYKAGEEFRPPSGWESSGGARGVKFDFSDLGGDGAGASDFSDFFEALFGDAFAGARAGAARGRGRSRRPPPRARQGQSVEASITISLEDAYRGATRSITLQTTETDEHGRPQRREKTYDVRIPPGTTDGAVIRLAGQGGAGVGGGAAGDVRLRVGIAPHRTFRVREHDLEMALPITPWEAALGAKVDARTLDGAVALTIPAGSQSGQKLRLKGKGLPMRQGGRGDLYVELRIQVPKTLTDEERKLLEEWRSASPFDPRSQG